MQKTNKLSAQKAARLTEPGLYGDGLNLWLRVAPGGSKQWLFRFMLNGKARCMGLGPAHTVTLAQAREAATNARRTLLAGIDPIEARKARKQELVTAAARGQTFRDCATKYIAAHEPGWRNPKHRAQWKATLEKYVHPIIGDTPVAAVDVAMVMKILEAVWYDKPETGKRVRGRIEAVLDWAAARGYRGSENPARWRGHLDKLLPARSKIAPVKHHAALPYGQIPSFMPLLRVQTGIAAKALEFTILTAARTGETIHATWPEFDLQKKVWTVPGSRMKAGREHRVPLSDRAVEILTALDQDTKFVFIGIDDKPLSENAMLAVLERLRRDDITTHGFRSTFRDWTAECGTFSREVAEMALAHAISDDVEAAYRRGDLFEKRQQLMRQWSAYCSSTPSQISADVIAFPGKMAH